MTKAQPKRSCVVCKAKTGQNQLLRIRFAPDSASLTTSIASPKPGIGRSAYICRTQACIEGLFERSRLSHALRTNVSDGLKVALREELACPQR